MAPLVDAIAFTRQEAAVTMTFTMEGKTPVDVVRLMFP